MKEIPLTQGYITIVDDEDYEMLVSFGSWYAKKTAKDGLVYAVCSVKNRQIQMGRVITSCPKGKVVDHINGSALDNRKSNLRVCYQRENMMNQAPHKGTASGYKGVRWDKEKKRWRAEIEYDGKRYSLGRHRDIKNAAIAYNNAAIKYHGEFARLNEI